MNTPAEVSKEHCALWNKLYNLAEDECFGGDSSDAKAAQLIVDSEARVLAEMTVSATKLFNHALTENNQLRAEVERLKRDYDYDHKCLHEVRERCESWKQRAERAEAEMERLKPYVSKAVLTREGTMLCSPLVAVKFNEQTARAERAEAALRPLVGAVESVICDTEGAVAHIFEREPGDKWRVQVALDRARQACATIPTTKGDK